jgi:hypothetical protein
MILPGKGKLLLDDFTFDSNEKDRYTEEYLNDPQNSFVPFEIPQEDLDTIIEKIETKEKLENLNKKVDKIFNPPNPEKAFNEIKILIRDGNYLEAYEMINKYRFCHKPLEEHFLTGLYCGLREKDKNKANDVVLRFGKSTGFNYDLFKELETKYLHRLEREGRILVNK